MLAACFVGKHSQGPFFFVFFCCHILGTWVFLTLICLAQFLVDISARQLFATVLGQLLVYFGEALCAMFLPCCSASSMKFFLKLKKIDFTHLKFNKNVVEIMLSPTNKWVP